MTSAVNPTEKRPRRPRAPVHPRRRSSPAGGGPGRPGSRRLVPADAHGRELVARDGAAGSLLLIDRDAATRSDERLIAHLAADEPPGNVSLLCRLYAQAAPEQRRCRTVTEQDAHARPVGDPDCYGEASDATAQIVETFEAAFKLERLSSRMSIPELRWTRLQSCGEQPWAVSLRECIASAQDYEPFCSLTRAAIALHEPDPGVSTTTLRAELIRVLDSPIILNRALREAVLERVESERSSLSEIAIRCGRVKRDSRGNQSGETSWLARRIGVLPEGGQREPTVWVHSDVLGLIARDGLGISPREVELQ
jgi:hypothetical protein